MEDRDEIGFYLKKINDFLLAYVNAQLKNRDLTFSQFHILAYIIEGTNMTVLQKDIEQYFRLKHPTVVGLLKRMEKKNMIRIEVNPEDRRGNRVVALPKGIKVCREMTEGRVYTEDILTQNLNEKQRKELKELLRIIYTETCTDNADACKEIRPTV
ncbi:MAG: MarR family winged helix-turn-helix transcriptional regulator [Hominilimicola sp.]